MIHLSTSVLANFSTTAVYIDQNSTNSTQCASHNDEEWIPIYILLIAVLGIVCNVFVLVVFCCHKKAFTVADIYLSNLAAADLVLLSFLPFWAVNAIQKFDWPFGPFLCRLINLGIGMNATCSIYFLVLVSIDRYMALVHPLSHYRLRRPKYAKLGCLMVWGLGLLLNGPTFIFRELQYVHDINITICFNNYPNTSVYLLFEGILSMMSFILPISIISYCTLKIIQALKNRSMEVSIAQKMENKATTLMLVVLVAFLICWVPFHLIKILEWLVGATILKGCALENMISICGQVCTYLACFNSVLNPILYVIVGRNFREKVWELFKLQTEDNRDL